MLKVKYEKKDIRLKDLIFHGRGLRNPDIEAQQKECNLCQKIIKSLPVEWLVNPLVVEPIRGKYEVHIGQNRLIALHYHADRDIMLNLTYNSLIPCFVILEKVTPEKLHQFYLLYQVWDEDDKNIRIPMGKRALGRDNYERNC